MPGQGLWALIREHTAEQADALVMIYSEVLLVPAIHNHKLRHSQFS